MEETSKIVVVVVAAVIMGIIGLVTYGFYGAAMGFVVTILIIALFNIWNKMRGE